MHIGGVEHAGLVECPQAGRSRRRRARTSVTVMRPASPASSRSDSATTSAAGGCQLNTPHGCPSITGVSGAAHAAHEQVQHAAEMSRRVVARLPPPQKAVQHNAVQQRLQRIVRVQHRLDQPRPARSRRRQRRSGSPSQLVL